MQAFLMQSLIASVVLTLALNLLPRLFPRAADRAEQRVHDQVRQAFDERDQSSQEPQRRTSIKVFFPWKAMLAISVVLTVLVNLVGYFAN
ncbi:MAG: hypothetical protein V3V01_16770 [Acidimicrobiales bacterium]